MDSNVDRDLFGAPSPDDVPAYPFSPAPGKTDTSNEAADAMQPHCGRLQADALATIKDAGKDGCTADEVGNRQGRNRWSVQPRISELRQMGLVVDSGRRRQNVTGKRAIVWVAAEYAEVGAMSGILRLVSRHPEPCIIIGPVGPGYRVSVFLGPQGLGADHPGAAAARDHAHTLGAAHGWPVCDLTDGRAA